MTATVVANETATAAITNTYTQKLGSLKITKSITGGGEDAANKAYTFTVKGPGDYSKTVTITGAGSETLTDLVPGNYTVAEENANIDGYTLAVTGGGTVTVEAEKEAEKTITNTYTQKLGSLKITKAIEGNVSAADSKTYTFKVTGPNEYSETVTITGAGFKTLDKLVPGTYTITEQNADIDGYTLDITGEGDVTVEAEKTVEATITNKYTPKLGSLNITKAIVGGGTAASTKTYTFTVTGPNGYNETVTITGAGTATLNDLVPGEYNVTENKDGANITGYSLSVTGEGTATVVADETAEVTVTNTYTELGSLTITKQLTGNYPSSARTKTYTFTVTGPDGYRNTVTITGASSDTLSNLVPGQYTVTENRNGAAIDNYSLTVTGGGNVTVEAGRTATVTVSNRYEPDPDPTPSESQPQPTPSPEQTPQPTPSPEQTPQPTPSPEQTPQPTPRPTATPAPTPSAPQRYTSPPEQNDNPNRPNDPNPPEENMNEDMPNRDVPLDGNPDVPNVPNMPHVPADEPGMDLPDGDVPQSDFPPVTGDTIMGYIWMSLLVVSGAGILITALSKKRDNT